MGKIVKHTEPFSLSKVIDIGEKETLNSKSATPPYKKLFATKAHHHYMVIWLRPYDPKGYEIFIWL